MTSYTDPGSGHLKWIGRFQWSLLFIGYFLWLLDSWRASAAFGAGGLISIAFWYTHRWIIARMLTPAVRMRWFFGLLAAAKLALIALVLHAMMVCFPAEILPLSVGLLLFAGGILLEAFRLIVRPSPPDTE